MSDPHIDDNAKVAAHDLPPAHAGHYRISVSQTLSDQTFESAPLDIEISAPRFNLAPADIDAVFPPRSARGDFHRFLPHVVLSRSTLPWQRSPLVTEPPPSAEADAIPWIALVVVEADDTSVTVETVPRATFSSDAPAGSIPHPLLDLDAADEPDQPVLTIVLPSDRIPNPTATAKFCHVRVHPDGSRRAFVVAHQAPKPLVRAVAHLVSLEGVYESVGPAADPRIELAAHLDTAREVRLVSLYNWDFYTQEEDQHGFPALSSNLDVGHLHPQPGTGDDGAENGDAGASGIVSGGFVPLEHHLRDGASVTSWYHGPLVPGPIGGLAPSLPARTADTLLRYDRTTGRLDVSYAAAWELGRLVALRDPQVAQRLSGWKRDHAHHDHSVTARENAPQVAALLRPLPGSTPPFALGDWFRDQLTDLGVVPFAYLVADESMLPRESLRFFSVDGHWIRCLHDGAFSLARTTQDAVTADRKLWDEHSGVTVPTMSGFALRSELLTGFPGMRIDALIDSKPVVPRRQATIAPDLMLALYDGVIESVELHMPVHHLHFEASNLGETDSMTSPIDVAGELLADVIVQAYPRSAT